MKIYLAPMEGITGYIFRNALSQCFGGVDRYFTPFITTHTKKAMNARETNDILPEHNNGIPLVPQIISKDADDTIRKGSRFSCTSKRTTNVFRTSV